MIFFNSAIKFLFFSLIITGIFCVNQSFGATTPIVAKANSPIPENRIEASANYYQPVTSDGELDVNFKAQVYSRGSVSGFARQSDGKMIITGSFKGINNTPRQNIARLNQDGSVDLSFKSADMDIPITITGIDINLTTGKIFVSGIYSVGSQTVYRLIRLNSDGSRDTTFATVTAETQFGIRVLESDGKIFIFGTFGKVNNVTANSIARLNPDGSLDQSFNARSIIGGFRQARSVGVQSDGKIVVAGNFTVQDTQREDIVRLNPNGSLDTTFTTTVSSGITINALRLQPDDKILIGGLFSAVNGAQREGFARLNADGTLDASVNTSSLQIWEINSIELQPDGKIIFSGGFTERGSTNQRIIRINPDGSRDVSFTVDNNGGASRLFLLPEGKLLIGGELTRVNGVLSPGIALLNENGSINTSYQAKAFHEGQVSAMATQSNGKILIAGSFISVNGEDRRSVVRLNMDGSVDSSFNLPPEILGFVPSIKIQPDQKILLAGSFEYRVNNISRRGIVRLTPEGLIDSSFNPGVGVNGSVNDLVIQPDGKIIIGGEFSSFNFVQRINIARVNSNGSLDTSFNTIVGGDRIFTLALQQDGKVIAGGDFTNVNNSRCLVRINEDSSFDSSFNSSIGVNSFCRIIDIALQPDGKVFIGGLFQNIENINRNAIARLNSNGSLDASFNTGEGANSFVRRIVLQPDGKLVVAGENLIFNNVLVNSIARVNNNGSLDASFQTGIGVEFPERILSLVLQRNGKILIGGSFDSYNNTPQFGIARLLNPSIFSQTTHRFDFDGDGKSDFSIFRPSLGEWWYYRSSDGNNRAFQFGTATDKIVPADYTGDGKTDIAFYRNGQWFILRSEDFSYYAFPFGIETDIPIPADYDGDGKADAAVYRPSETKWYIFKSTGGVDQIVFGGNGEVPVPADYDGDGKVNLATFNSSNNTYRTLNVNNAQSKSSFAAASGDVAVPGDYTGDGKADPAVYSPASNMWAVIKSEDQSVETLQFGAQGDIPAPADYDGDGKTDFAIYRPSTATWWYAASASGGQHRALQFGISTDKPVPSAYIR